MQTEILIALIGKLVDERLEEIPSSRRGRSGRDGRDGADGRDFNFAEHEKDIRAWAKEFALKFEDLSDDEIEIIRGPRGRDGRDGSDGHSFIYEENRNEIESAIRTSIVDIRDELKLRFSDLTETEISELRGPRGRDGRDFSFDENCESIQSAIKTIVSKSHDELKLRFTDLTETEVSELRGSRGRDGRDGRNFVFEEHKEYFDSLKLKFADLSAEEKAELTLRFSHLSDEDKEQLKLKFADLTDDDRLAIRGPRGLKGQRGRYGRDGKAGQNGARGLPGPQGVKGVGGLDGRDGADGEDGVDAPYITDIEVDNWKPNEIYFIFHFSNGSSIKSNRVEIPQPLYITMAGGNGASGGSGGGGSSLDFIDENGDDLGTPSQVQFTGTVATTIDEDGKATVNITGSGEKGDKGDPGDPGADGESAYQLAVDGGFVGTEAEWLASLVGPKGDKGDKGDPGDSPTESTADLADNQTTPADVTGLLIDTNKSFYVHYFVERTYDSSRLEDWGFLSTVDHLESANDVAYETGLLLITRRGSTCKVTPVASDNDIGTITYSITDDGQVQYVSSYNGGSSGSFKIYWKILSNIAGVA